MKQVLSKSMERQLRLAELINQSNSYDSKYLAEMLNTGTQTIVNDIKQINSIIYPLEILESLSFHYFLEIPDTYSFEYIYGCFLTNSTEFQLLEIIMFDESCSYQELADRLFISVSSLRRLLSRINSYLSSQGLKVESNPCRLVGDEFKATNFLCHYLMEKYTVSTNFLNEFEQELLETIIETILTFAQIEDSFSTKEMAKFIFMANVIRIKNGHHNHQLVHLSSHDALLRIFKEMPLFNYKFKEVFKIDFTIELLVHACHIVFQPRRASSVADLAVKASNDPEVEARVKAIETVIATVEDSLSLELSHSKLVFGLYNLVVSYYGPISTLKDLDRYYLKEIEQRWPDYFQLLKGAYEAQVPLLHAEQFSSFAFFLSTEWVELMSYLQHHQRRMRIGLYFTTTDTHMKFISGELELLLPNVLELVFLKTDSEAEVAEKRIDLLMTNINANTKVTPSICVSRYLSTRDVERITNFYNNWVRRQST